MVSFPASLGDVVNVPGLGHGPTWPGIADRPTEERIRSMAREQRAFV